MSTDCKEIVEKYLRDNGHDGLAGEECGCQIDDLFPCGEFGLDCVPGKLGKCDCGDHDFHIVVLVGDEQEGEQGAV